MSEKKGKGRRKEPLRWCLVLNPGEEIDDGLQLALHGPEHASKKDADAWLEANCEPDNVYFALRHAYTAETSTPAKPDIVFRASRA